MARGILFLAGWCAVGLLCSSPARAETKSLRELTPNERLALQESEERLAYFDRSLTTLDNLLARHKISYREYLYEEHDLNALIGGESQLQNELLTKHRHLTDKALEALENVLDYGIIAPTLVAGYIAGYIVAHCNGSFSP